MFAIGTPSTSKRGHGKRLLRKRDGKKRSASSKRTQPPSVGAHLGWLSWCGKIYFGFFRDVDGKNEPVKRLVDVVGDGRQSIGNLIGDRPQPPFQMACPLACPIYTPCCSRS